MRDLIVYVTRLHYQAYFDADVIVDACQLLIGQAALEERHHLHLPSIDILLDGLGIIMLTLQGIPLLLQ